MTTGEKIKRARTRAKLSQKKLGEMVGVTQQAIGQYEADKSKPTLNILERLTAVLEDPSIMTFDFQDPAEERTEYEYQEMIGEEMRSFDTFLKNHGMNVYSEYSEEEFIQTFLSFDNSTYKMDNADYSELHNHIYNITKEVIRTVGERQGLFNRGRWENPNPFEPPFPDDNTKPED